MGVVAGISYDKFPKQCQLMRVKVCFNYDTDNSIGGVFVRDDLEEPYIGIIKLDDGRYVLTTECQYSFK